MTWAGKNINLLSGIKGLKQFNFEKKLYKSFIVLKNLKIENIHLSEVLKVVYLKQRKITHLFTQKLWAQISL